MITRNEAATPIWMHTLFAATFLLAAGINMPLNAQGLESEGAVQTIVGSEVQTGEASADADGERIAAAIANTAESIQEVRRRFNLDEVAIVLLDGMGEPDGPVATAVEENLDIIRELRIAIEGSAMFFHAVDSRSILLDNVIAMEFHDDDVIIFAIGGGEVR